MLLANFKPKSTAVALHGFLATAQLSCFMVAVGKSGSCRVLLANVLALLERNFNSWLPFWGPKNARASEHLCCMVTEVRDYDFWMCIFYHLIKSLHYFNFVVSTFRYC